MPLNSYFRDLLLVNLACVGIYTLVFMNLDIGISKEIMFYSVDAKSYVAVAQWMEGIKATEYTAIRPMLYPFLLMVSLKFGLYGLWMMQFLFWILSINLVFAALKKVCENKVYAYIAVAIMCGNFSYIAFTLHALAEVTTCFLLCWLCYHISMNIHKAGELKFFHGFLLLLILLALVKPVYYPLVLLTLFIMLPIFYFKKYLKQPSAAAWLVLILFPFLFQIGIMYHKHDTLQISKVGGNTFRGYLLAQGMQEIEGYQRAESVSKANELSSDKIPGYIRSHLDVYLSLYLGNLFDNIDASSEILKSPKKHRGLARYMSTVNTVYFYLHLLFFVPFLLAAWLSLRSKHWPQLIILLIPASLIYAVLLTSGISFWAGDRLVLPVLGVWVFLYLMVVDFWVRRLRSY